MLNAQNRRFVPKRRAAQRDGGSPPNNTQTEQPLRGWDEAAKSQTHIPPVCSKKESRATLREQPPKTGNVPPIMSAVISGALPRSELCLEMLLGSVVGRYGLVDSRCVHRVKQRRQHDRHDEVEDHRVERRVAEGGQRTAMNWIRNSRYHQPHFSNFGCVSFISTSPDLKRPSNVFSRDASVADCPNPSFGHVADLIACHRRKIFPKEKLPYNGRRAGFCHLCRHPFEKALALFGRVLNIQQLESCANQKRFHFVGSREMAD